MLVLALMTVTLTSLAVTALRTRGHVDCAEAARTYVLRGRDLPTGESR
ncbi:hypothetical protein [Nocardioides pakistanensis]